MHFHLTAALSDTTDALCIIAFDRFRAAFHEADLALPAINAFAQFNSAVDFAFQAMGAAAAGDAAEAEKFTLWCRAKLADMETELAKLVAGVEE